MGKGAMEADLFGDGRSIFTDGLGDGRLGRAIGDTGKDDPRSSRVRCEKAFE